MEGRRDSAEFLVEIRDVFRIFLHDLSSISAGICSSISLLEEHKIDVEMTKLMKVSSLKLLALIKLYRVILYNESSLEIKSLEEIYSNYFNSECKISFRGIFLNKNLSFIISLYLLVFHRFILKPNSIQINISENLKSFSLQIIAGRIFIDFYKKNLWTNLKEIVFGKETDNSFIKILINNLEKKKMSSHFLFDGVGCLEIRNKY